jgi:hypothetical protein
MRRSRIAIDLLGNRETRKVAQMIVRFCMAIFILASVGSAASAEVDFAGEAVSPDARRMAEWVVRSGDADGMVFVIIDKIDAKVFAFSNRGHLLGASPALLGFARGDDSPPGIGTRKLADISRRERITPSGRFIAGLGRDLAAKEILWVDYEAAISLHRVFTGNSSEGRLQRLATKSPDDNRISYGCINVPVEFYERVISSLFSTSRGIVYVLPETRTLADAFPQFRSTEEMRSEAGP